MNIEDLGSPAEPTAADVEREEDALDEAHARRANAGIGREGVPNIIEQIRAAALNAQASGIREGMIGSVLELIDPISVEYDPAYTTEAHIERHVELVARFVTGLADALGVYLITGEVKPLSVYVDPDDEPETPGV